MQPTGNRHQFITEAIYLFEQQIAPFERAHHESSMYDVWHGNHLFVCVPAMAYVQKFLMNFKEFPQRQKVGVWTLDAVLEQLQAGASKQ